MQTLIKFTDEILNSDNYADFFTAQLMRDSGWDEPVNAFYEHGLLVKMVSTQKTNQLWKTDFNCSAPTIEQVKRWKKTK